MAELGGLVRVVASSVDSRLTVDVLDEACREVASLLGVESVGVTVASRLGPRAVIGASGEHARTLEDIQVTVGDGPCTEATRTGLTVRSPDLHDPQETRWTEVTRQMDGLPIRAVTATPLLLGRTAIGSLDVHSTRPGGLDDLDLATLDTAVRLVTVAVLALRAHDPADATGPSVFAEIPQATGMVIAALGLNPQDALDQMRASAFLQDRLLVDVARDIVAGRLPPDLSASEPESDGVETHAT